MEQYEAFMDRFGKYDFEMERYFDFELACESFLYIVRNVPKAEF